MRILVIRNVALAYLAHEIASSLVVSVIAELIGLESCRSFINVVRGCHLGLIDVTDHRLLQ